MKLRNRIKMLEMEEKRAQKKLVKTKQKAHFGGILKNTQIGRAHV